MATSWRASTGGWLAGLIQREWGAYAGELLAVVPAIRGGATVMDGVFTTTKTTDEGNEEAETS